LIANGAEVIDCNGQCRRPGDKSHWIGALLNPMSIPITALQEEEWFELRAATVAIKVSARTSCT
jgi:hypothetical protein